MDFPPSPCVSGLFADKVLGAEYSSFFYFFFYPLRTPIAEAWTCCGELLGFCFELVKFIGKQTAQKESPQLIHPFRIQDTSLIAPSLAKLLPHRVNIYFIFLLEVCILLTCA